MASQTCCVPFAFTVKMSQYPALRIQLLKSRPNWLIRNTLLHHPSFHLLSMRPCVIPKDVFVGESTVSWSGFQCLNSYEILNMWSQRSVAHFVLSKWLSGACVRVYFSAKGLLVWHKAEMNPSTLPALYCRNVNLDKDSPQCVLNILNIYSFCLVFSDLIFQHWENRFWIPCVTTVSKKQIHSLSS